MASTERPLPVSSRPNFVYFDVDFLVYVCISNQVDFGRVNPCALLQGRQVLRGRRLRIPGPRKRGARTRRRQLLQQFPEWGEFRGLRSSLVPRRRWSSQPPSSWRQQCDNAPESRVLHRLFTHPHRPRHGPRTDLLDSSDTHTCFCLL